MTSAGSAPPRVSVVVPAWRAEPFIVATVESVLAQTKGDLELVVVDDASPDGTVAALEKADIADPRFSLVVNDVNLGYEANWNRAVSLARAPAVLLLCSDDVLYPEALERLSAALDADGTGRVAMAVGRRDVVDVDGAIVLRDRGLPRMAGVVDGREVLGRLVRSGGNCLCEPSFTLFRRSALDEAGPFSARRPYPIDVEMYHRILRRHDLHAVDVTLGAFRLSGTSLSAALARRQGRDLAGMVADIGRDPVSPVGPIATALGYARARLAAPARRAVIALANRRAVRRHRRAV